MPYAHRNLSSLSGMIVSPSAILLTLRTLSPTRGFKSLSTGNNYGLQPLTLVSRPSLSLARRPVHSLCGAAVEMSLARGSLCEAPAGKWPRTERCTPTLGSSHVLRSRPETRNNHPRLFFF